MGKFIRVRSPYAGAAHVFLATPSYTGALASAHVASLVASTWALRDAGIAVDHATLNHDCHVDDARNAILREFMQTECTDLVFLDADVGWEPVALVALVLHDADVVAGVYPKKGDDNWPVFEFSGQELRARPDGLVEVSGAPTGFMRIRRHVVEKLIEANRHRRFAGQKAEPGAAPYTIVFERTYEDGRRWSGDYAFCRAWQKLGGKIFVDPEMRFVHVGEEQWSGCLGDFWRDRAGIDHPVLGQAIAKLRAGETSYEVFAGLFNGWGNHFSAEPALLATAFAVAKEAKGAILETGSGLTSIVMGIAAEQAGYVEIHALEHDLDYFKRTQAALRRYGITNVRLHYAPLRPYTAGVVWYEVPDALPQRFSVVLCDGPPQRFGRHGLFALLGDRIADAHVIMDDAGGPARPHLDKWATQECRSVSVLDGEHRPFAISPAPAPA